MKISQTKFKDSWKNLEGAFCVWRHLITPEVAPKSIVAWAFWLMLCGISIDCEEENQ